jgi:hypothetical protein
MDKGMPRGAGVDGGLRNSQLHIYAAVNIYSVFQFWIHSCYDHRSRENRQPNVVMCSEVAPHDLWIWCSKKIISKTLTAYRASTCCKRKTPRPCLETCHPYTNPLALTWSKPTRSRSENHPKLSSRYSRAHVAGDTYGDRKLPGISLVVDRSKLHSYHGSPRSQTHKFPVPIW